MPKFKLDINPGDKFKMWTVIERNGSGKNGDLYYLCKCDCGHQSNVTANALKSGRSWRCRHHGFIIHGHAIKATQSPEYYSWQCIKQRCLNITNVNYKEYGGKGITICKEWANSFEAFLRDMGTRPFPKCSVERIDNSKGYSKDNCKWGTDAEQARNKKSNVVVMYMGKRTVAIDWVKVLPIGRTSLYSRLHAGKTIEEILKEFNLNIKIENGEIKRVI